MKKRHTKLAVESMKIGAGVGLVAALLAGATGHKSGMDVAEVQPMKLAAMEALYDGGTEQGLKIIEGIEIPYGLSIMATNDPKGFVPGINDLLNGYTTPDGKVEPSVEEKIERGKKAIEALARYREAKFASSDDGETAANNLAILKENMKYFGYGYIKDKNDVVPPVLINFWAFRVMVGLGCLFILFFAVILAVTYKFPKALFKKYDITTLPAWHYWIAILLIPLGYIASESGWLVAEFGRQPWTIQDMLPTWAAVSDLQSSSVMITFFLFLVLFTTMLAVEINILLKQIKKGPAL
jgi:cytochrome d ubiquinol oxidase subunit I